MKRDAQVNDLKRDVFNRVGGVEVRAKRFFYFTWHKHLIKRQATGKHCVAYHVVCHVSCHQYAHLP